MGELQRFVSDGTANVLVALAQNPALAVQCTFSAPNLGGFHIEDDALDVWFMPQGCLALNAQRLDSAASFTVQALCRRHSDSQTPIAPPTLLADLTVGHAWSKANDRTPILQEGFGLSELREFAQTDLGILVCRGLTIPPDGGRRG